MKKTTTILTAALFCLSISGLKAQYCTPPPWASGPYTGITNVTLETLDNTSTINDGGSEVYTYWTNVNVPSLNVSTQYAISITTQIIGSGNNSRVWIDWNQDQDFDDNGEEVCTWNSQPQGTLTANFTVPSNASTGTTRMRVYTDMDENQGHITPEPCGYLNYPNHSLMQHGEVEDYDVDISLGSGIEEMPVGSMGFSANVLSGNSVQIKYTLASDADVQLTVFNLLGKSMAMLLDKPQRAGEYNFTLLNNELGDASGFVFIRLTANGESLTRKLFLL